MNEEEAEDDGRLFPDVGSVNGSDRPIRVRFFNMTATSVDVFWLNLQKQPTKYGTLGVRQYLDIQTFQNHPWVARRARDGCKALMNKLQIFWPPPAAPNVIVRTMCYITMKVQSLKDNAAYSVLKFSKKVITEQVVQLPRELQYDVKLLQSKKEEYDQIVCRALPPVRQ